VGGVSLEFVAEAESLRFYLRAASQDDMDLALAQLRAAHPQVEAREVALAGWRERDPAWCSEGEEACIIDLGLSRGPDLPVASDWHRQGDPLLGVLAAASAVEGGERVVCQLALAAAPPRWGERLRARLAALDLRRTGSAQTSPLSEAVAFLAFLGLGALGLRVYLWYRDGDILPLVGLGAASIAGLALIAAVAAVLLGGRTALERGVIEEKLAHPAFAVRLRIAAFAPPESPCERIRVLAENVARAYGVFDHPAGNGLRTRRVSAHCTYGSGDLTRPVVEHDLFRRPDVLNAAELAGLWHLPVGAEAPPAVEHGQSRRLLPEAEQFSRGCPVGVSRHQGRSTPVHMPAALLHRNQLIVAKTRRGKSTLLLHQACHLIERLAAGERLSLVVIDPHQDLAEPVLAAVPPHLEDRVVYLNLADTERPVGLNLLDPALFLSRDRTSENVVTMLRRLWPENWGPRMEGALRASVASLYEANRSDRRRPEERFTLLDVVPLLSNRSFREEVLAEVPDLALQAWWQDNYESLSRSFQQQIANPVTTKVGRFIVTEAGRLVLGQARSTFDPRSLVRHGGVLVVNSAVGVLGEGGAALMGATILNLITLVVEEQVMVPTAERNRLVALVDESSTLGAADYPRMLSELGKYGASFVLVTQSLSKLDAIDRNLKPTVFANIDGLTVFQVSAEDARYLAPELGGDLEVADLTDLDDFDCYARWWSDGRRLPTFSLRVNPPMGADRERVRAIAHRSAQRYGRPRDEVAAEIDAALRQHLERRPVTTSKGAGSEGASVSTAGAPQNTQPTAQVNPQATAKKQRSRHRGQG
jgi:hypothetical protein